MAESFELWSSTQIPHQVRAALARCLGVPESRVRVAAPDVYIFHAGITRVAEGMPVWGTCAGAIFLAKDVPGHPHPIAGVMDIAVERNAFGRQLDSFETDLDVKAFGGEPYHAVFIRAPKISRLGNDVETLATLDDGTVVAVRQGNLLATSFHPELTADDRFHRYFLSLGPK